MSPCYSVFKHQDLQMFGLNLKKKQYQVILKPLEVVGRGWWKF